MSSILGISGYDVNSVFGYGQTNTVSNDTTAQALSSALNTENLQNSTDEELMDVCKSFESYFVEQVMKEAKKMVRSEDEENQYIQYLGDTLLQEYSDTITEQGNLGIAQMLYDSMKRNGL